jgi:hypothetical protein
VVLGATLSSVRRGRWAAIAATIAIVATGAVAAGCGGGSNGALSLDPVAAAATKTQHAGAARIRLALALSSPQLHSGKTLRLHGSGAIDGTSGELTFRVGSTSMKAISLERNGDYVVYLRVGALAERLPGGQHWVELDLSKLAKSAGLDFGQLLSASRIQPGDLLAMLEAEGAEVRNLGSATVDGAATTHYRVTVDVAKALQATGSTSPLLGGISAQIPKVPVDVWIGKDSLVHRIAVSLGRTQTDGPLQLAMTMDIYDYGADVTIAAPPSSDVFDATQLAQQGFGSTSD